MFTQQNLNRLYSTKYARLINRIINHPEMTHDKETGISNEELKKNKKRMKNKIKSHFSSLSSQSSKILQYKTEV